MNLKKIFSTLLAAVFIWTAVSPNLLYAQGVAPAPVNFQTANMPANDVAGLFKNFARVTSSEDFGGNTVVLNIQDFHMHPEVQRNIAAVIDVLETNYGIEKVFTEGAYGKVSLDWFFNIKDAELRSIIAEELLKDGIFTGSEYYAALNNKENFIYGIENEQVHQANIKRMAELIEKKDFYKKTLSQMNNDLIFLQKKYFNPANKKLSRLVKDHKSGKTASHKYYRTLLSYLQKNSEQSEGSYGTIMPLDLNDYPNILLFLRSDKLKRSLNNSKVSSDLQKIVLALRGELSYTQYQKLLYSTDNFKDTTALISHLNNLPEEFKTKYFTRDIKSFIEITSVFHVINPVELIKEERKLVENIRIALSLNKNELEVSFLSDFFLYFEDYMTTSIAADDHEYFENRFDKFKNMWVKYSFYNVLPQLEADFAVLSEYYSVNDKRNEIFISELSKHFDMKNKNASNSVLNKKAEDIISGKSNVIVCITGGYHSKGLSELLAGKNISYAVITPSISGDISAALQNYEALAVEQAKIFSQALALSLFSQVISYSVSNDNPGSYGFAAKLFTTAARTLEKMPHNDENVNRLIGNLNEAVGKDFKFSYDKNTGEVSFASADGKFSESFIKISQNAAGNMLINNTYSSSAQDKILLKSHGKILDKVQMSEFMDNFAKTFKTGTLNYGFDLFAPSVYYLSVSVVDWAVKNNIFLDISKVNGVSFRMAEIYALDKEILSKNPRVAKYPEQWQNAVMLQLIKKQDYSSSNWRQALFAANLLSEILPVSHDTLMMYESFPGNMVSVISEEANALRKGKRLEYDKSDLNDLIELGVVKARGNIGEIMSLTSVQILSQAHANLAKRENRPLNVTIISDTRYGGNEFVKAAAGVFLANGFNVMVFDSNMPTPFGSFQKDIVVNITASHNKGNDNGYKFTIDGAMVPRAYLNSLTEEITRIVDAEKAGNEEVLYVNPEGKYSIESSKDGAFEYAQSLLSMLAGFFNKTEKELLDIIEERQGKSPFFLFEANNGTAPALLGEVLDVFGIKSENVEVRHPGRDVGFGLMYDEDRGSPEPNERNLTNLRKYLEKLKGLIFAGSTDADADRIGTLMYSENGEIKVLTPNDTALIIAYAILKSKAEFSGKDAIVRSLPSGHILDYLAASFGVRTISVPVGAKHISKEFADKDNNVLLGMESSGTIFLNDWIRNKDGIMVNLLMYLIPVITGENYSGIFKEIYEKIGYTPYSAEDKLNLESKTKDSSLDFFKRATKKDIESLMDVSDESIFGKNARIETVKNDDGLYIGISNDETRRINSGFSSKNPKAGNLETGDIIWLLMRASGSENTMRIYSESYDKNMSGHLIEIGKRIAQGESANIDSSFMTTDETVKNYISKHPFIKWLYESSKRNKEGKSSVRRAIALSVISVSRSKLGAPVAELRNLSEALAAKLSGNESMLEAFVNSHNYENFGKAQLRNALEDIFKIIQAMNDDGASQDEIDKVIANMHRDYNKSLIIPSIKAALFSHLDIDKSQINDFDSDWYVKESFNPFDIDSTNIALIGPTNSGKTGMGNKISEDTGLPVLTIGTFLKAKAKQVQEIREKKKSNLTAEDRVNLKKYGAVEKKVNAGKLVPYRILVKIVFEELEKDVYKDGFIIDGFPSEMRSAHALNKFLIKRGKRLSVIELAADSQTIRDRQLASGGEINARFENKLKVYANSTAMVARYYKFLKYGERNNDYFDYVRFDEDELGLENLTEQIYPALIERINDIKGIFSSMKGDISVRNKFTPSVPKAFKNLLKVFGLKESDSKLAGGFSVEQAYPNTYGKPVVEIVKLFSKKKDGSFEMSREQENAAIVFYGGTASGGHNVIVGLFDMLKKFNSRSKIYGIMDGPRGFAKGTFMRLTPHFIELVKNTGGFGALRTGRGSKEDTFDSLVDNLQNRGITSLVVVGGDGTNTFAAKFSEHMKANNIDITVVSVPKTIDADFLNDELEATFGFDTFIKAAAVSLGSLVNNMISSAKQSWFVEVMGRETSNLTAELAVRTNANGAVLSEEVLEKNMTLKDVINYYTDIIVERSQNGINFGLYLLPEGLIPGIPEMEKLINQFDLIYEDYKKNDKNIDEIHAESIMSEVLDSLPEYEKGLALSLPPWFRSNLFFQRESDSGRLRYTKIETTKLIEDMVAVELRARKEAGKYNGNTELQKDSAGYGPNAAKASWFDATYSYTLGLISGVLIAFKKTGYMAYAKNLSGDVKKWIPKGIPVANMVGDTKRIKKSPVNLRGDFYAYYMEEMERNRLSREYAFILSKEYAFIDNPQLSGADGKKRNLTLS
ncbi:MAG: nucleoside monophosphate kinase, partial [Endomicrobia bacterium]|nr:nucleoside monophosphate kinase [Endomicrobiia bacterium]